MENNIKNEIVFYVIVLIALISIVICNNVFWHFGKEEKYDIQDNITYLETNNIVYNVPYEEVWLD